MSKLNVLIAGSTGYIGIQLTKLLLKHKNVKIKFLCGSSSKGKLISYYDKALKNKNLPKITEFKKEFLKKVDVVFTALPNGEAQKISNFLLNKNILIDLSADFRLKKAGDYLNWYKINANITTNIKLSIRSKIPPCPGKIFPVSLIFSILLK